MSSTKISIALSSSSSSSSTSATYRGSDDRRRVYQESNTRVFPSAINDLLQHLQKTFQENNHTKFKSKRESPRLILKGSWCYYTLLIKKTRESGRLVVGNGVNDEIVDSPIDHNKIIATYYKAAIPDLDFYTTASGEEVMESLQAFCLSYKTHTYTFTNSNDRNKLSILLTPKSDDNNGYLRGSKVYHLDFICNHDLKKDSFTVDYGITDCEGEIYPDNIVITDLNGNASANIEQLTLSPVNSSIEQILAQDYTRLLRGLNVLARVRGCKLAEEEKYYGLKNNLPVGFIDKNRIRRYFLYSNGPRFFLLLLSTEWFNIFFPNPNNIPLTLEARRFATKRLNEIHDELSENGIEVYNLYDENNVYAIISAAIIASSCSHTQPSLVTEKLLATIISQWKYIGDREGLLDPNMLRRFTTLVKNELTRYDATPEFKVFARAPCPQQEITSTKTKQMPKITESPRQKSKVKEEEKKSEMEKQKSCTAANHENTTINAKPSAIKPANKEKEQKTIELPIEPEKPKFESKPKTAQPQKPQSKKHLSNKKQSPAKQAMTKKEKDKQSNQKSKELLAAERKKIETATVDEEIEKEKKRTEEKKLQNPSKISYETFACPPKRQKKQNDKQIKTELTQAISRTNPTRRAPLYHTTTFFQPPPAGAEKLSGAVKYLPFLFIILWGSSLDRESKIIISGVLLALLVGLAISVQLTPIQEATKRGARSPQ